MFNFLPTFDNLDNSKVSRNVQKIVNEINELEPKIQTLSNNEIQEQIQKLIREYQNEQNLDNLLTKSFALTKEISWRTLGLKHFDSQLIGGCTLNEGKIAEMKTGEGKTLVATLPAVLNALTLEGVHIVTVNDYLAKRDEQWMGQIYRALGLSVGLIQEGMNTSQRKINYKADITYVTNSELAFDYLRDNMAPSTSELVQRAYSYCIVDEIDSILIDEARTPLIISETKQTPVEKYIIADETVNYLKPQIHYNINEKTKTVTLTTKGIEQTETLVDATNLYDVNDPWIPYILNALKANTMFERDTHYIVKNDEVIIIDEFTGRIMADRRWSDGLHQAMEAKEKTTIKQDSETLGSITYQNFFRLYPKLSGMTGTAKTGEEEFKKIYNLNVIPIPTTKPVQRVDKDDLIYTTEYKKWKAVADQCYKLFKKGQPILIGTVSIEKSEILSQLLSEYDIPHKLLNAKPENIQRESEIIAQAGCYQAVTVATNMAGRGTDILLGGNPEYLTKQMLLDLFKTPNKLDIKIKKLTTKKNIKKLVYIFDQLNENEKNDLIQEIFEQTLPTNNEIYKVLNDIQSVLLNEMKEYCNVEKERIKKLGGLYVIGTERHESKRIDNQLRGRSGRQGDPGVSRFFLSLDDDLFRIFGGSNIKNVLNTLNVSDDALQSQALTRSLDNAQSKVENYYYDSRKQIFEYDEVLNVQRLALFKERRALLEYKTIRPEFLHYGETILKNYANELKQSQNENKLQISKEINYFLQLNQNLNIVNEPINNIEQSLCQQLWIFYELKEFEFELYSPGLIRQIEKEILLNQIDLNWQRHLNEIELLKDSIRWRGYGQLDPLAEYKREGYNLFIETIQTIKYNSVYELLTSQFI